MKKRLLALLLVAFVLCTMAISSFSLSNKDGYPSMGDYAYLKKEYSQYPEWDQSVDQTYFNSKCPVCGASVTCVNMPISEDIYNSSDFGTGVIMVGSYYCFDFRGFKTDYFIMKDFNPSYSHSNFTGSNADYFNTRNILCGKFDDGNYYFYLHYELDTSYSVSCPYYIGYYRNSSVYYTQNEIENYVVNAYANLVNQLNTNNDLEVFSNRCMDYCVKNYISSPYQSILMKPYIDDSYNDGYSKGEQAGYKNGFQHGTVKGQDMTKWTFHGLFDDMFKPLGTFLNNIFSLGIGDITIRSVVGLCGIVYVTMFIIKIVRG